MSSALFTSTDDSAAPAAAAAAAAPARGGRASTTRAKADKEDHIADNIGYAIGSVFPYDPSHLAAPDSGSSYDTQSAPVQDTIALAQARVAVLVCVTAAPDGSAYEQVRYYRRGTTHPVRPKERLIESNGDPYGHAYSIKVERTEAARTREVWELVVNLWHEDFKTGSIYYKIDATNKMIPFNTHSDRPKLTCVPRVGEPTPTLVVFEGENAPREITIGGFTLACRELPKGEKWCTGTHVILHKVKSIFQPKLNNNPKSNWKDIHALLGAGPSAAPAGPSAAPAAAPPVPDAAPEVTDDVVLDEAAVNEALSVGGHDALLGLYGAEYSEDEVEVGELAATAGPSYGDGNVSPPAVSAVSAVTSFRFPFNDFESRQRGGNLFSPFAPVQRGLNEQPTYMYGAEMKPASDNELKPASDDNLDEEFVDNVLRDTPPPVAENSAYVTNSDASNKPLYAMKAGASSSDASSSAAAVHERALLNTEERGAAEDGAAARPKTPRCDYETSPSAPDRRVWHLRDADLRSDTSSHASTPLSIGVSGTDLTGTTAELEQDHLDLGDVAAQPPRPSVLGGWAINLRPANQK
jgi:hypothetical protein